MEFLKRNFLGISHCKHQKNSFSSKKRMGNLFSSLGPLHAVNIDLRNVTPKEGVEANTYNQFQEKVLKPANELYTKFMDYKDGQDLVKAAIRDSSQANKDAAWNHILPNVYIQMDGYHFSETVSTEFVNVISSVLNIIGNSKMDFFTEYPALTKCVADGFDVCLKFDQIPIKKPMLQNDLAYFRRNCPAHNQDGSFDSLFMESNMSTVFWGSKMPFTTKFVNDLKTKYKDNPEKFNLAIQLVGLVADCCTSICTKNENPSPELCLICLRCLTTAVVIYDYIHPVGAFCHDAKYHYREAVDLILNYSPKQSDLIDILKYSTNTLSKPTTDSKIKELLK